MMVVTHTCNRSQNRSLGGACDAQSGQLSDTCFQYHNHFIHGGQVIERELLIRTLLSAYDWAEYKWSGSPHGQFKPQNWYGLQITVDDRGQGKVTIVLIAWLLETVYLTLKHANQFQELNGLVTEHNQPVAEIRILLQNPTLDVSNSTNISANPTIESGGDSTNSIAPIVSGTSDTVRVRRTDISQGHASHRLASRGTSPHTYSPAISTRIQGLQRLGGSAIEYDLMGPLLYLARTALTTPEITQFHIHKFPSPMTINMTPKGRRASIRGLELLEALIDLVEWEYGNKERTGTFWTAEVTILRTYVGVGTREVAVLRMTWGTADQPDIIQLNATSGADATS